MHIKFTDKEKEILRRISRGEKTREIAETMYVTTRTIEQRLNFMRAKTGARNTVHLIAMAVKAGWFES